MPRSTKSYGSSRSRLVKVSVQAYLEPEQATQLRALSDLTQVPMQTYLREGVDMVIAKYAQDQGFLRMLRKLRHPARAGEVKSFELIEDGKPRASRARRPK